MTNYEFMNVAKEKMEKCWADLNARFGTSHEAPVLTFDLKSKSTAGVASARYGKTYIALNFSYVQYNAAQMIARTVPHEVAHCWLYATKDSSHMRQWGVRANPHGYAFSNIMHILGADDSRTHNYQLSDEKAASLFAYKCGCRTHHVTRNIHGKILRGQRRVCSRCRGTLTKITE